MMAQVITFIAFVLSMVALLGCFVYLVDVKRAIIWSSRFREEVVACETATDALAVMKSSKEQLMQRGKKASPMAREIYMSAVEYASEVASRKLAQEERNAYRNEYEKLFDNIQKA